MGWTLTDTGSWVEATTDNPAGDMPAAMALPQSYRWHVRGVTVLVRRDQAASLLGPPGPPVTGYAAWYDAAQITGQADNTPLGTWPDLSSNHLDGVSPGGTQRPTYYKTTAAKLVNGKPAVWFAPPNDMVSAGNGPIPQTVLAVAGVQSVADDDALFATAGGAHNWLLRVNSGNVQLLDAGTAMLVSGVTTVPLVPSFYAGTFNGTTASVYVNSATPDATAANATVMAAGTYYLASRGFSGVEALTGPLCEVLVYSTLLSPAQIAATYAYLKAKWGTP